MRWQYGLALWLASCVAGIAPAEPPLDEDALPAGAMKRLGSRKRRPPETHAHALLDGGRTLLTVHDGPTLRYWNLADGSLRRVQSLSDRCNTHRMLLTPDGRVLVAIYYEMSEVWDVSTGRRIRSLMIGQNTVDSWLLTPDGASLVAVMSDRLFVHDLRTGWARQIVHLSGLQQPVALALDGRAVIAGAKGKLCCWELQTGRMLWSIKPFLVHDWMILPGGRRLWVDGADATLFDLTSGRPLTHRLTSRPEPSLMHFAQDGRTYAKMRFDGCAVRDLFGGVSTTRYVSDVTRIITFSADGSTLIGYDQDGALQCWDIANDKAKYPRVDRAGHVEAVDRLAFLPDNRRLLAAAGGDVRRWDIGSGRSAMIPKWNPKQERLALTWSADGRQLFELTTSKEVKVFDVQTGSLLRTLPAPAEAVGIETFESGITGALSSQIYSPPGGQSIHALVLDNFGDTASLLSWDLTRASTPPRRRSGFPCTRPSTVAGTLIFAGDGSVQELGTGRPWRAPTLPHSAVELAAAPAGNLVAVATDAAELPGPDRSTHDGIHVREVATGRTLVVLPVRAAGALTFAPDGRRLVTACPEWIQVWDVFTGTELKRWAVPGGWHLPRSGQPVAAALAVSRDGRTIASGHPDGTILFWPMPPARPAPAPTSAQAAALWADLAAADAGRAWRAAARLVDAPEVALALLRDRLAPTRPPRADETRELFDGLNAERYTHREAAQRRLTDLGDLIEAELRTALAASRSPEQSRRLKQIQAAPRAVTESERLRRWRAVTILEQLGTSEASELLKRVAASPAGTAEAEAANVALRQLDKPDTAPIAK